MKGWCFMLAGNDMKLSAYQDIVGGMLKLKIVHRWDDTVCWNPFGV